MQKYIVPVHIQTQGGLMSWIIILISSACRSKDLNLDF